ncbi:MAG: aspartate 1-decarboxylase [Planctomycetes bacterium]|jgi:aspartate 1-decarboxylase|nr:aspartate 1-decarboxylase [Planctomycetota bacterium]
MLIKVLKSKLHRAHVTEAKLHYPGSIEIDENLMGAAGIVPYEAVTVADLNNGNRLETYVVPGEPGSGRVVILGAAAQLVKPKDIVIIFSFALCTPEEAAELTPKIVVLDENNRVAKAPGTRREQL